MIVAVVLEATAVVVTVNVAVVAPAATLTDAGVCAEALLDPSVTLAPPDGAGPVRVTVPVDGKPPITDAGESATDCKAGGFTVSVAVADELL